MAINPNIALGIDPIQIQSPYESQAKAMNLRAAQQNAAMNDIQLEEHRQKLAAADRDKAAQAKLSELLAAHSKPDQAGKLAVDHTSVYRGLADSGFGDVALKYDAARRADMKSAADAAKAELENVKTKSEMVANILGAVRFAPDDQKAQAYQVARGWAIQRGIIGEQDAPPEYNPQFVDTAFRGAVDAKAQAEQAFKDLEFDDKVAKEEQRAIEQRPKTAQEWLQIGARLIGAATDQQQHSQAMQTLANLGAPKDVLDIYGDVFSERAAQRALQTGMTPDQAKPQPGVDVPYSAEVEAQKRSLAAAGRSQVTVNTAERANFRDETTLRKEFGDLPTVKAFNEVSVQVKRAREAYGIAKQGGSTNSADQVIVTVLNKVLDPASVVRESEYARTAEGQSVLSRLEGYFQKMKSGGAGISGAEREAVMLTIEALGKSMDKQYQPIVKQYRGLASEYGFNPDRIVQPTKQEGGAPAVGGMFNGQKIVSVREIN